MVERNKELIALLEDERDTREAVRTALTRTDYEVVESEDGESGLASVVAHLPGLVLLDLGLPRLSGLEVCRRLKALPATREIPIIMHTAHDHERDVILGLDSGADDYVSKMCSTPELLARIRAVLRRRSLQEDDSVKRPIVRGGLIVDPNSRAVTVDGERVPLTEPEFRLLHFLVSYPERAFSRDALLDQTVGADSAVVDRNIDVRVAAIRRKIGPYRGVIETIRGVGYRSTLQ